MEHALIWDEIEYLKDKLNKLVELQGTQSKEVLKCSEELDELIVSTYKRSLLKKPRKR